MPLIVTKEKAQAAPSEIKMKKENSKSNLTRSLSVKETEKETTKEQQPPRSRKDLNNSKLAAEKEQQRSKSYQSGKKEKSIIESKPNDKEEYYESALSTNSDVSFLLTGKTSGNSKESSSNSFGKFSEAENKQSKPVGYAPVNKSFDANKFNNNNDKNKLKAKNEFVKFEPKKNDQPDHSTNNNTFKANSKRDPLFNNPYKKTEPIAKENKKPTEKKETEYPEFQRIEPIKVKKNGPQPKKRHESLPLVTQSFSVINESTLTKRTSNENVKLPNLNTSRSSRSQHSSKPTNNTKIRLMPTRRYYDPGYKRCPCLMHRQRYNNTAPPDEEQSQSHSTHDYWNDTQDYELIFGKKYLGYYPAKQMKMSQDFEHHHTCTHFEDTQTNEHILKRAPWNPVF